MSVLNVRRDASREEITKAYHNLARKYHPDKDRDDKHQSGDKFRQVKDAYETLRDDHKREAYDRFDLPIIEQQNSSRSHSHRQNHHRQQRDEGFFRGKSDTLSEEQKYQDELDRIRKINSDLLEEVNAKIKRQNKSARQKHKKRLSHVGKVFVGEILPEENDEDYEKIVIDRLKALAK